MIAHAVVAKNTVQTTASYEKIGSKDFEDAGPLSSFPEGLWFISLTSSFGMEVKVPTASVMLLHSAILSWNNIWP